MKYFFVVVLFLIAMSCNKSNPPVPNDPGGTDTSKDETTSNVYFVGDSITPSYNYTIPVYWNNDTMHLLPNTIYCSASSIAFAGNDMYIGCSSQYIGNYVGYWKNGTGVNVTDNKFDLLANVLITVSGKDVYFSGIARSVPDAVLTPAYWKNNDSIVLIPLTFILQPNQGKALAVSGKDVYIGGASVPPVRLYVGYQAVYWKNGIPTYLPNNDTISSNSIVNAVAVNDTDVYTAGTTTRLNYPEGHAVYWKNGKVEYLTTGDEYSVANAITVVGNDVYIGGAIIGDDDLPRAAYWKNGKLVQLDSDLSIVNAIGVDGKDVYAAGMVGNPDAGAYWKNGVKKLLQKGHILAMAIKGK